MLMEATSRSQASADSAVRDGARDTGPALESWYRFLLSPALERCPRREKFLIGDRIQSTALNVLESFVEATCTRNRKFHLARQLRHREAALPRPSRHGPEPPGPALPRARRPRPRRVLTESPDLEEDQSRPRRRGLPIGNLTSQLCANVHLDGLDHF